MAKPSTTRWVYGIHAVSAVIKQRPEDIIHLYYQKTRGRLQGRLNELIRQAQAMDLNCQQSNNIESKLLAFQQPNQPVNPINHQGVIAQIKPKRIEGEQQLKQHLQKAGTELPCYLVLDGITDPHNIGSIVRSAEAAAVTAVIMLNHHNAPINATVHKTSSGAVEFVPIFVVSNLARIIRLLNDQQILTIALAIDEQHPHGSFYDQNLCQPVAIVLGSEHKGVRPLNQQQCQLCASLPMLGVTQSLNVANAASVALYETLRQRQVPDHNTIR